MPLTLGRPSVTQPSQRITFQCFFIFGEEELKNLPLLIVGKNTVLLFKLAALFLCFSEKNA